MSSSRESPLSTPPDGGRLIGVGALRGGRRGVIQRPANPVRAQRLGRPLALVRGVAAVVHDRNLVAVIGFRVSDADIDLARSTALVAVLFDLSAKRQAKVIGHRGVGLGGFGRMFPQFGSGGGAYAALDRVDVVPPQLPASRNSCRSSPAHSCPHRYQSWVSLEVSSS